jgi:hypothetical protein
LLLKVHCKGGGGCCGSKKDSVRFAVLTVMPSEDSYVIDNASKLYNNHLRMARRHGTWRGSIFSMGLHEDPKFLCLLEERGLLKKGCKVIE